jgi:hypothetical protein
MAFHRHSINILLNPFLKSSMQAYVMDPSHVNQNLPPLKEFANEISSSPSDKRWQKKGKIPFSFPSGLTNKSLEGPWPGAPGSPLVPSDPA